MRIRRAPSGAFQARLMIDGRQYTATFSDRDDATAWVRLTRAQAVIGMLPGTAPALVDI